MEGWLPSCAFGIAGQREILRCAQNDTERGAVWLGGGAADTQKPAFFGVSQPVWKSREGLITVREGILCPSKILNRLGGRGAGSWELSDKSWSHSLHDLSKRRLALGETTAPSAEGS
jgi:hypothetical protein